jgi:hypothetical protein
MSSKNKRGIRATTFVLVVAVMQAYVGVGLAARTSSITASKARVQNLSGILTTQGNRPITVNGASAVTGATILSGATIETPDQETANINIPGHGSLEIQANTKFTLTFDQNGIKVNVIQGCLVLFTKKGTSGEVDNAQGVVGKSDSANDGRIEVCPTRAAAAAAGGGGLFGLGTAATVAIIGGGVGIAVAIALGTRSSSNPSGVTP